MNIHDARPDDLISTSEASKIAERSERTIRRWAQPSVGKLRRWLGEPAVTGGAAPVLVSRRELMTVLAVNGQQPRFQGHPEHSDSSTDMPATSTDAPPGDIRPSSADVRVVILEERLKTAELRAALAAIRAERDGLARQVADLHDQINDVRRRSDNAHAELRLDLTAERGRCQALAAELKALRELQGSSWLRRVFGGATRLLPAA